MLHNFVIELVLQAGNDVTALKVTAHCSRNGDLFAVAFMGDTGQGRNRKAFVLILQDDINNPGNSIRTVSGGSAITQDFNPLNHCNRNQ